MLHTSCAVQELELSRLKHDKLSDMLAAATAAQQAADQKSRRLEIKFARSDKGHALMRSAKLQANVTDLEARVSQLQGDCHHQVRHSYIALPLMLLTSADFTLVAVKACMQAAHAATRAMVEVARGFTRGRLGQARVWK